MVTNMKKSVSSLLTGAVTLLLLSGFLSGCTAGRTNDSQSGAMPAPALDYQSQPEIAPGTAPNPAPDPAQADPSSGRDIIRSGDISLAADQPITVADTIVGIVEKANGHVDNRSDSPASESGTEYSSLTLRIPNDSFTTVSAEITDAATLITSNFSTSDVTQQTTNLDARISALQASVDRLTQLLANATSTADLIAAESALAERQAELDGLISDRAYLSDQVAYSTLTVSVNSTESTPTGEPSNFWEGLVQGWESLGAAAVGAVIVAGVLIPWLVVAAIVSGLVWWVLRSRRRARRSRALPERPELPDRPVESPPHTDVVG